MGAGKAYIKAIKNSEPIERASLFAAKAYISAAATYSSAPDNSCIAAKHGFVTATGKGNEEVVKGMEAWTPSVPPPARPTSTPRLPRSRMRMRLLTPPQPTSPPCGPTRGKGRPASQQQEPFLATR